MERLIAFDDVLITPQFSTVSSRQDVNLSQNFLGHKLDLPVISSNMDTVTGHVMARTMKEYGALGCLHRFWDIESNVEAYLKAQGNMVSVGLGEDEYVRACKLFVAGASTFIIDVAHGACDRVIEQAKRIRHTIGREGYIVAGNFATAQSLEMFLLRGGNVVDAVKVGIGGGCFVAGTRILMSNGTYKNIEDVVIGDKVINKLGKPVNVIGTKNSGIKKVIKYKNNTFYKDSFATSDHLHWVGDHSTTKDINDHSLVTVLDKLTKKDESKFKWKQLGEVNKCVMLLPKNISFDLPTDFTVNFKEFFDKIGNFVRSGQKETITPDYNLGYVFGTFLGDGCQSITDYKGSTRGQVAWYFNVTEKDIADKVCKSLKDSFGIETSQEVPKDKNIILVHAYSLPLARLFSIFGKKDKKELPQKYLCSNKEYLRGLFDGLVDSDGCYQESRISFYNTSPNLMELFGFLNYVLFGYYPSGSTRAPSSGGLKNCKDEDCKEAYVFRGVGNPKNYLTEEYQISRINSFEECSIELPTFDIEVDCETHSFIANNIIVHNSACSTRVVTGCGAPTLQSIIDCSDIGIPIIADGGIRTTGDIAKSLAAGASVVMLGRMFAGCDETPTALETLNGPNGYGDYKMYRGSASLESYQAQQKRAKWRAPEGEAFLVKHTGPASQVLQLIEGGLRSALSYVGATNLKEFREKAVFSLVTSSGAMESHPHGKQWK